MPNRIVRNSIKTSETLDGVSAYAERLFYRLLTEADDYGRFLADPRVLLAGCFPLKIGSLKPVVVKKWRDELAAANLLVLYQIDGRLYGYFPTWDKHNRVRAKASKHPAPDNTCQHVSADDNMCEQAQANDSLSEDGDESESESESGFAEVEDQGSSHPSSKGPPPKPPTPSELRSVWNEETKRPLPMCREMSTGRAKHARARLKEQPDMDEWREVCRRIQASPFCRGEKNGDWVADIDWLLRPDTRTKVLEGKYEDKASGPPLKLI